MAISLYPDDPITPEDDPGYLASLDHELTGTPPTNNWAGASNLPDTENLDTFLDTDEPPYEWIVPGLIERADRIILTGPEGGGKSTLMRQLSIQLGSGIHPFTDDHIDPVTVLLVDCENSRRQSRRRILPLRHTAQQQDRYTPGNVHIINIGGAIDVCHPAVEADLTQRITNLQVDVLVIGPLYKMATGDPVKEEPSRALADALDRLRAIRGTALLIEAHTPYAENGGKTRQKRPYGASLWSRWPEFGIHLDPQGKLDHWRGPRDEREWPQALIRATPWPWAKAQDQPEREQPWDGPRQCMAAIVDLFHGEQPAAEMSGQQVIDSLQILQRGFKERTVRQALEMLRAEGDLTRRTGPRNSRLYTLAAPPEPDPEMFENERF